MKEWKNRKDRVKRMKRKKITEHIWAVAYVKPSKISYVFENIPPPHSFWRNKTGSCVPCILFVFMFLLNNQIAIFTIQIDCIPPPPPPPTNPLSNVGFPSLPFHECWIRQRREEKRGPRSLVFVLGCFGKRKPKTGEPLSRSLSSCARVGVPVIDKFMVPSHPRPTCAHVCTRDERVEEKRGPRSSVFVFQKNILGMYICRIFLEGSEWKKKILIYALVLLF